MDENKHKNKKLLLPGVYYHRGGRVRKTTEIIALLVELAQGTQDEERAKYLMSVALELSVYLNKDLQKESDE